MLSAVRTTSKTGRVLAECDHAPWRDHAVINGPQRDLLEETEKWGKVIRAANIKPQYSASSAALPNRDLRIPPHDPSGKNSPMNWRLISVGLLFIVLINTFNLGRMSIEFRGTRSDWAVLILSIIGLPQPHRTRSRSGVSARQAKELGLKWRTDSALART